jgi:ABC-type transport system involved in cytochrome c biogenesis permease component
VVLSFPLIARELRVQSRRRSTYSARVGWGMAAIAVLLFYTLNFPSQSANGKFLLSTIHFYLFVMLFLLAPVGASDAISREKREGTLGLLFLTRLTPRQVVLGKLATHFIRLFYIALMMLPFLMLPVLLGGVDWKDFVLSTVMLFSIAAAGVSAGLVASALLVNFGAALCWAMCLAVILGLVAGSSVANAALLLFPNGVPGGMDPAIRIFIVGPALMIFPVIASEFAGISTGSPWFFWFTNGALLALSVLFLAFAVLFAARRVARHSELAGETSRQAAFRKQFLTPILWRETFRRHMRSRLARNPLIWLEYRTAWARTARWGMILLIIAVETGLVMTMADWPDFLATHFFMILTLVTFLTFKSASSFQGEKESGAFELILVTPFTERKLWAARLRAVASYYGLPVFLLFGFWLYGLTWSKAPFYYEGSELSRAVNFTTLCASIVSAPVAGLYFALRCRTFLPALLWTGGIAVLGPICLWSAFHGLLWMSAARGRQELATILYEFLRFSWWPVLLAVGLYHLFLIWSCGRGAIRFLRERDFITHS